MTLFGPSHIAVLITTALSTAALCFLVRRYPSPRRESLIAWALAGILVLSKLTRLWYACSYETLSWATWHDALPMHLCDWACITSIIALATRSQTAYELTYFWGLAGTMQAILTPDLNFDFPDIRFITFFVSHCGIVVVLLYMTIGLRFRPTWTSVWKVLLWGQVYLAAAGLVNWSTGANYGYLCHKPLNPSLLDHLGPWPWYILSLEVLALVFYVIYYLPFFFCDLFRSRNQRAGGEIKS